LLCSATQLMAAREEVEIVQNVADQSLRRLAGRGITFPDGREPLAAFDAHGRELVWREHHRESDETGGKHVFYRLYLVGEGYEAEFEQAEVALHYEADGRLYMVNGRQYTNVAVSNRPDFDAVDATVRARHMLKNFTRRGHNEDDTVASAIEGAGAAKLRIRDTDGELRYVWHLRVTHGDHPAHEVVVDASTEQIVASVTPERGSNCFPDSQTSVTATGIPQRAGISNRVLGATVANPARAVRAPYTGGGTYSHEAFWAAGPLLAVHQGMPSNDTNELLGWQCIDPYTSQQMGYTLMGLNTSGGVPTYTDYFYNSTNLLFHGKSGADALYHTRQTMLAFSTMGRNSWDGAGSNATVVVDSNSTDARGAAFRVGPRNSWDPPGASVGIGFGGDYLAASAALDVIAHEWGHGVTYSMDKFTRTTGYTVSDQLDEGFADVIGNIVEKMRQTTAGYGAEQSSDWTMHEDQSGNDPEPGVSPEPLTILAYSRGARDDGSNGHVWKSYGGTTPAAVMDKIHFEDPDVSLTTEPHTNGNMLVMAMRLMTEGTRNPLCIRYSATIGCAVTDPERYALGFTNARKIMWNTLPLLPKDPTWLQVANKAIHSAYIQMKACGASPTYVPVTEQKAVRAAFRGIGIEPTEPIREACGL
jgi:hypothetical protein